MADDTHDTELPEETSTGAAPKYLSRRHFLRAGATAMPVVLTLQSGEALARTSNLIGAAPNARDDNGDVLCLDTTYEDKLASGKVDIGNDGAAIHVLPDTDFYSALEGGRSGVPITADMACQDGGYLKTQGLTGGWHDATLPRGGIVVSNMAMHSIGGRAPIVMKSWFNLT